MLRDLPDDDEWIRARQQAIGERVKARRLECNLTQETTYLSARVDRRTLQALELGQGNPTYETLLRLSHVLDIPLADLVR